MQRVTAAIILIGLFSRPAGTEARGQEANPWGLSAAVVEAIKKGAPDEAPVKPARPRKVLVYGRLRTHPESVPACFQAIETLAKKTGAFQVVSSGDPEVFAPESLKQFDAVVMNNTHEPQPMLPLDFQGLDADAQKAATARAEVLGKSLLDFVAGGKGVVGIHGATAGIRWPAFLELMGGAYGGHITDSVWVKPEEPSHPLCAPFGGKSFEIRDEIYFFKAPYDRKKLRVLTGLDLDKTADPKKREDKDYAVSWVRPYGQGRVFYCSLGHVASAYCHPLVLRHYLAGIQFATGDLKADMAPR